jgi:hypothetical protein
MWICEICTTRLHDDFASCPACGAERAFAPWITVDEAYVMQRDREFIISSDYRDASGKSWLVFLIRIHMFGEISGKRYDNDGEHGWLARTVEHYDTGFIAVREARVWTNTMLRELRVRLRKPITWRDVV